MDTPNVPAAPDSKDDDRRVTLSAAAPCLDDEPYAVHVSHKRIVEMGQRSKGQVMECAKILPEVLQHPTAIFEGIRRDEDEANSSAPGWRCYVGLPSCSYNEDGTSGGPWKGEVFLVFINQDRVAYYWSWGKCDPDQPRLPKDHDKRFRRRLK